MNISLFPSLSLSLDLSFLPVFLSTPFLKNEKKITLYILFVTWFFFFLHNTSWTCLLANKYASTSNFVKASQQVSIQTWSISIVRLVHPRHLFWYYKQFCCEQSCTEQNFLTGVPGHMGLAQMGSSVGDTEPTQPTCWSVPIPPYPRYKLPPGFTSMCSTSGLFFMTHEPKVLREHH